MFELPIAIIASREGATHLAHSALPNAPVVPEPEPRVARIYRTRAALSGLLARIADAVAPKGWTPAHHVAPSR
jgi:hypothetical protein